MNQKARFALPLILSGIVLFSNCKKSEVDEPSNAINVKDKASVSYKEAGIPHTKSGILTYFRNVVTASKIIVGQQCGDGDAGVAGYSTYIEGLNNATGIRPALIGLDYGWSASTNITNLNNIAIDHWNNKKGLVTISWHADNPFETGYNSKFNNGGRSTDAANISTIDFDKLLSGAPASTAKTNYRNELKKVADGLVALKNAGVVVIWRPFHENNAPWFWWCTSSYSSTPANEAKFQRLWKDMYDYFYSRGLYNNLIWCFSLNARGGGSSYAPMNALYTVGTTTLSSYVDIVGADFYSVSEAYAANDLSELQAFGKTICASEVGPYSTGMGNWDEVVLMNTWRGKAAYFLQWSSWNVGGTLQRASIIHNKNYNNMLWSSYAIGVE